MSPKQPTPMSRLKEVFKMFEDVAMPNIGNKVELTRRNAQSGGYFETEKKEIKTDFLRIYQKEQKRSVNNRNESFGFAFNYENLDKEQIMVTFQDENKVIVSSLALSIENFRPIMKSAIKEIKSRSAINYDVIKSILENKFLPDAEAIEIEIDDVVNKAAKERIVLSSSKEQLEEDVFKAEKSFIKTSRNHQNETNSIPELQTIQELEMKLKELKDIVGKKKEVIDNKYDIVEKKSDLDKKKKHLYQVRKNYDNVLFLASRMAPYIPREELDYMILNAERRIKKES